VKKRWVLLIFWLVFAGLFAFSAGEQEKAKQRVVLLGASIGRAWSISGLPERIGAANYSFEYVPGGGFDKTNALIRILSRQEDRPGVIFIKECAAYFPGDLARYKSLMEKWVELCRQEDVVPVPATVVPVTRLHAFKKILIDIIKGRNPLQDGNPFAHNRNRAICQFNDWIRKFSEQEGLAVLDLEAAVRYSESNRFLKENYARLDGLHLNSEAYRSLDRIVIPVLEKIDPESRRLD
jgi:hypothetical protein